MPASMRIETIQNYIVTLGDGRSFFHRKYRQACLEAARAVVRERCRCVAGDYDTRVPGVTCDLCRPGEGGWSRGDALVRRLARLYSARMRASLGIVGRHAPTDVLGAQCDGGRTPCAGPCPAEAFAGVVVAPDAFFFHRCDWIGASTSREHLDRMVRATNHRGETCLAGR